MPSNRAGFAVCSDLVRSETTSRPAPDAVTVAGPQGEVERLQRRIDHLSGQLLGARDAALGAEAELGVARGRITELEQRVHVLTVEVSELRAALERSRARGSVAAVIGTDRPRRLARDLARRVRRAARRLGA